MIVDFVYHCCLLIGSHGLEIFEIRNHKWERHVDINLLSSSQMENPSAGEVMDLPVVIIDIILIFHSKVALENDKAANYVIHFELLVGSLMFVVELFLDIIFCILHLKRDELIVVVN